ncbi:MAG: hypothetical protein V1867_01990 [Candidatus Falkowbacteria bacterium]
MSQNTGQQPTNENIYTKKIVPIINSILDIEGKDEPGHKYAWRTFKKRFSGDPLFGSDKWEVSKSVSVRKTADTLYLIILNGKTVFEAKDPVGNTSAPTKDPKNKIIVLTFVGGDWPRLFFLLRNRVKAGKLKSD